MIKTKEKPALTEKEQLKKQKKLEKYYAASQWQLMGKKLCKHKLAVISFILLIILYFGAIFAPFLAPKGLESYSAKYANAPPTTIHFFHEGEFVGPFVYDYKIERDQFARKVYVEDTSTPYKLDFFCEGEEYDLFGIFPTNIHLFGVEGQYGGDAPVEVLIFGGDALGRDLFSRILFGSQVSLTIPLIGTLISFILGVTMGGISGYFGGWIDIVIQRICEVLSSFPTLPLWMALSAAIPVGIPVVQVFIMITVIMSMLSWPGLARSVRGKFMTLKNEDYVLAARLSGVSTPKIISKHLVPGFMGPLIVNLTLGVPQMILGETSMSFLGLGMRAPATSWGVLLQECQSINNIANCPWKLIPVIFVGIATLAFNFLGDGLRDAADPYK